MTKINLDQYILTTCNYCNGTKLRTEYEILRDGKVREKEETCSYCKGSGKLLNKKENIEHELIRVERNITYREKILTGQYPIPYEYYYNKEVLNFLENNPYANVDLLVLKMVENELLEFKNTIQIYKHILAHKTFNKDIYKDYNSAIVRPCDHVCVRCALFLDGTDSCGIDSCELCCNETCGVNDNAYSKFTPIHEEAKNWYNNGGYELNMNYDSKHNYMVQ